VKDGQAFLPGIQAMAAPGHTVGHMVLHDHVAGKDVLPMPVTWRITT